MNVEAFMLKASSVLSMDTYANYEGSNFSVKIVNKFLTSKFFGKYIHVYKILLAISP